jgi:glycosyltransferase involved in cell wall biosynthesis
MPAPHVTVAVLTFRRPTALVAGLLLMLEQIEAAEHDPRQDYEARIVVVDNDPAGSAREAVAALAHPAVAYVVEPTPGIAAARNRALDEARSSDALVFIDDDERPRAGWLDALVHTWREHGSAAVAGRVVPVYPAHVTAWIVDGGFFVRRSLPTGTRVDAAPTSNILFDVGYLRSNGLRFDAGLGLGGGEDTKLTRQIVRSGGEIVWCDESVVEDYVPDERAKPGWVLQRAWSHGNTSTNVDVALASTSRERLAIRATAFVGGAGRVVAGAAQAGLGAVTRSHHHQARGLRAVFRGAGMAAAAAGIVYHEYAKARRSEAPIGTSEATSSTV